MAELLAEMYLPEFLGNMYILSIAHGLVNLSLHLIETNGSVLKV